MKKYISSSLSVTELISVSGGANRCYGSAEGNPKFEVLEGLASSDACRQAVCTNKKYGQPFGWGYERPAGKLESTDTCLSGLRGELWRKIFLGVKQYTGASFYVPSKDSDLK